MASVRLEERLELGAVALVDQQVEVVVPRNEAVVPVRADQCAGVKHVVHACLLERREHQRQQLERHVPHALRQHRVPHLLHARRRVRVELARSQFFR